MSDRYIQDIPAVIDGYGPPQSLAGSAPNIAGSTTKVIGPRIIEIDIGPIAQTGAAVTTDIVVPFLHRLLRVEVKHTDGSDVDSVTAFTWSLKKAFNNAKGLLGALRSYTNSTVTDFIELFGYEWVLGTGSYQISTNTTNGHRVYVRMVVEQLG